MITSTTCSSCSSDDALARGEAREAAVFTGEELVGRAVLDECAVLHDEDRVKVDDRGCEESG